MSRDAARRAELRRRIRLAEDLPRASCYADAAELLYLDGVEPTHEEPGLGPPYERDVLQEKIREVRRYAIQVLDIVVDANLGAIITALTRDDARTVGYCKVDLSDTYPVAVDLYVHHGHRRRGVGTAIMREAIAVAEPYLKPLHVYYLPDSPGRPLVEGMGFVPTGARGFEGQPDSDDYIWAAYPEDGEG